ncbi:NAD(P)H-binding protein [Microbacterium sp. NPDC055988]|uniref:NAD(P)H-binding protein n=1 Tax=Microbacterium sp. NPDC055988 TaxID=3345671 RepID=UPI0035DE91F7
MLNTLGGELAKDKVAEHSAWKRSRLDWTLVRVPRLIDGPPTEVDHDAHVSGRRTTLRRSNLARFIADAVAQGDYPREAPFVSDR